MAENYKHLYEQMKKMVTKYQDEIVPGLRKVVADLESQRPMGRWERSIFADDFHRCSECASVWSRTSNYCPNCGADMREG